MPNSASIMSEAATISPKARNVIVATVISLAIVVITMTSVHFFLFNKEIRKERAFLIDRVIGQEGKGAVIVQSDRERILAEAAYALEGDVLKSRYAAVDSLILTRISTVYVIIVSGLIMVVIGSIFILFRINDPPSQATGEWSALKFQFSSASPGLIMALAGGLLVVTPWLVDQPIRVREGASYVVPNYAALQNGGSTKTEDEGRFTPIELDGDK
jgi:hypothetical protein